MIFLLDDVHASFRAVESFDLVVVTTAAMAATEAMWRWRRRRRRRNLLLFFIDFIDSSGIIDFIDMYPNVCCGRWRQQNSRRERQGE
jgi:hypothetical protein